MQGTSVAHPITGKQYPLVIGASAAAESVGITWRAIVKLCEAGEIAAAPHDPFEQWRIYTLPLWRKFGLSAEAAS